MAQYTYKKVSEDKNKLKYEVTVKKESFDEKVDKLFKELSKSVKIPGFRPGNAPRKEIESTVMPKAIIQAYNEILPEVATEIVYTESLNPIDMLNYDLKDTKLDDGVVFTFEFINQPQVDLDAIKKIKVKFEVEKVTDEEVDNVIKSMARNTLGPEKITKYEVETKESKEEAKSDEKEAATPSKDLVITDELVVELGYEEKTYEELKKRIRETLENIKKQNAENLLVNQVIEQAIKTIDFFVPENMVKSQAESLERSFRERLSRIKLDADDYLKTQNTTIEAQRELWIKEAENEVRAELIMVNIANAEGISPSDDDVKAEIEAIQDKNLKKEYSTERGRDYVKYLLTRERGLNKIVEVVKEGNKIAA